MRFLPIIAAALVLVACAALEPTATQIPEPSPTPEPTSGPEPTQTPWPTLTPTPKPKPTTTPIPTLDMTKVLTYTGTRLDHGYCDSSAAANSHEMYSVGCTVSLAVQAARDAEREMKYPDQVAPPASFFALECSLEALGPLGPTNLCSLRSDAPQGMDKAHPDYMLELYRTTEALHEFHNMFETVKHRNLAKLTASQKARLSYHIERVFDAWNRFRDEHDAVVCQYIVCG